ncbi:MAG TPA: DUF4345 domain-containing protein [Pilimelia sp.]|nr:DUF4345 domain-containing protein [Pilimelia sp.]
MPTTRSSASRRGLQITLGVLALIPIGTGLLDVVGGPGTLPSPQHLNPDLESNYRFFATIWLGFGLFLVWIIPRVEREVSLLRAVSGIVFAAGAARVLAMAVSGRPHPIFQAAMVLELVAPPVLVLWQHRVAREAATARD